MWEGVKQVVTQGGRVTRGDSEIKFQYRKISSLTNRPGLGQFTIGQISELTISQTSRLFRNSQKLSFLSTTDFEKS